MIIQGKSHEEIINTIKYDLYQDIGGPVAKLGKTEWGKKSMAYAEQMRVNKRALAAVCEIESGCRNLTEVHGDISGPFQMTQATYNKTIREAIKENPWLNLTEDPIENGHDIPEIQTIAATQDLKDAANTVKSTDILNPTALDTRGYYQFGHGYGYDLANATPDETMGSILTKTPDTIFTQNRITKETTVGEWRNMVRKGMGVFADEPIFNH